jgi:hypothetical protein
MYMSVSAPEIPKTHEGTQSSPMRVTNALKPTDTASDTGRTHLPTQTLHAPLPEAAQ